MFRKESKAPLEDLGVPIIIISGVPPKFLRLTIKLFREGITKACEEQNLAPLTLAFSCAVEKAAQKDMR